MGSKEKEKESDRKGERVVNVKAGIFSLNWLLAYGSHGCFLLYLVRIAALCFLVLFKASGRFGQLILLVFIYLFERRELLNQSREWNAVSFFFSLFFFCSNLNLNLNEDASLLFQSQ